MSFYKTFLRKSLVIGMIVALFGALAGCNGNSNYSIPDQNERRGSH